MHHEVSCTCMSVCETQWRFLLHDYFCTNIYWPLWRIVVKKTIRADSTCFHSVRAFLVRLPPEKADNKTFSLEIFLNLYWLIQIKIDLNQKLGDF